MLAGSRGDRRVRLRTLVTGVPFLVSAAVVAVVALAYVLAGFFLVPRLIASYVPRYVQEQLGRQATVGEVRVNPLLFRLEVKDFRLREADGRAILSFARLLVDFQLSSIFRRAWTFAEIALEEPRLDVSLAADGRVNVAELLRDLAGGAAEARSEPAPPRRVLLQHAVVRAGSLSFTDLSGREPRTAAIEPVDVELRDITTLPERRGPYAIAATLAGGGVIGWEGQVSLVPLGSTGRFGILGFPLATAWRFLQDHVALAEPGGRVDADVRYELAYREGAAAVTVHGLDVTVADLALTRRGDTVPLLALERVRLGGGRVDLAAREATVPELSLTRGRVSATIAPDGTLDWQTLITPAPAQASDGRPAPAAASGPAWRLALEKLRIEDVALAVTDRSRVVPVRLDVAGVGVALSATLRSTPAGADGRVDDLGVTLARVAVSEAAAPRSPVIALEELSLAGGRVELAGRRVAIDRLAARGGITSVVRAPDGSLPLLAMLAPAAAPRGPAPAASRAARAPATTSWAVSLGRLDLADHRIVISDASVAPPARLDLQAVAATARDVRTDSSKPFAFDAGFRVASGGRVAASGQATADGRAADASLTVSRFALAPAQPYIAAVAAVVLRAGDVSTTGRLSYRGGRDRPTVRYTGAVDVNGVRVVEEATGEPVLGWTSLRAAPLRVGLAPDRLEIDEVRLAGLDGRLVIFRDKTLNVARLMKPPGASPSPAPPARASAPGAASAFPVVVERVRIDGGSMDFADLSLVLPFATRVHELQGVVAGLASDPESRATLKLDGRVDEFGLVMVGGALSSFHPKTFTDVTVIFRNVPMSTLSPYSATFAGRRIQSGTMDLDLEYRIDRGALVGENKVLLRQLQLGERVESPGAMRLPLDLAIAILSDAEGRIDIALPVRGNVDQPEFSYGHLIWQAIVTVITRVVTSPFRALAGLVGADAESLQTIAFEPGSDAVPPPERQKLQRVAEALAKRPRLKLTVHGGYEPAVDGEALRSLQVRRDLARRLDVALAPGEDPGPVAYDQARTQRALEALLAEREGDRAVEAFVADYEKRTGKAVQRVNPVLALVGRGSPDRAFYEALFRRLVETAPLPEDEVTALGRRRGDAAARALREHAGTAAARVEVGDPAATTAGERNQVPTRLELGAAGAGS